MKEEEKRVVKERNVEKERLGCISGEIEKAFALMDENIIIHGRVMMVRLLYLLFVFLFDNCNIYFNRKAERL